MKRPKTLTLLGILSIIGGVFNGAGVVANLLMSPSPLIIFKIVVATLCIYAGILLLKGVGKGRTFYVGTSIFSFIFSASIYAASTNPFIDSTRISVDLGIQLLWAVIGFTLLYRDNINKYFDHMATSGIEHSAQENE